MTTWNVRCKTKRVHETKVDDHTVTVHESEGSWVRWDVRAFKSPGANGEARSVELAKGKALRAVELLVELRKLQEPLG